MNVVSCREMKSEENDVDLDFSVEKVRSQLQQIIWDNEKLLEDRVFALATGSFAISLTVFQIQKSWVPLSKWLMLTSWVILLAAVILIIYSLYYARNGAERAIKSPNSKLGEVITNGNKKTKRLNAISYFLTFGGILLTAAAAIITILSNY